MSFDCSKKAFMRLLFFVWAILLGHPRPLQQPGCWHHLDLWVKLTGAMLHRTIRIHQVIQLMHNWRLDQLFLLSSCLWVNYIQLHTLVWCSFGLCFRYDQQELAAVFKKIGDKQTCTIGLYELYRITQLYPKVFCQVYFSPPLKLSLNEMGCMSLPTH